MWTVIFITVAFQFGKPPEVMSTEIMSTYTYITKKDCDKDMNVMNVSANVTLTHGKHTVTTQGLCIELLRRTQ